MRLSKLSKSEWEDWLANPITEAVRDAVGQMLAQQQAAASAAYWAGKAWPEAERLALCRMLAWHEDFFTASHEEIQQVMERE